MRRWCRRRRRNAPPWHVIPRTTNGHARWWWRGDHWALDGLDLAFPDVDKEKKKELEAIREALLKED